MPAKPIKQAPKKSLESMLVSAALGQRFCLEVTRQRIISGTLECKTNAKECWMATIFARISLRTKRHMPTCSRLASYEHGTGSVLFTNSTITCTVASFWAPLKTCSDALAPAQNVLHEPQPCRGSAPCTLARLAGWTVLEPRRGKVIQQSRPESRSSNRAQARQGNHHDCCKLST